uniref:Uncharacterized protein n=1 Tax=Chelonoidis abingdonii TaxID=106734 RepID=A0A8C0H8K2_CHEAB
MGTRAFSHDSIFIPDGQAESEQAVQAMSQDKILGKVKTLQVRRNKYVTIVQRGTGLPVDVCVDPPGPACGVMA